MMGASVLQVCSGMFIHVISRLANNIYLHEVVESSPFVFVIVSNETSQLASLS